MLTYGPLFRTQEKVLDEKEEKKTIMGKKGKL
jgi:hypothetical protein